MPKETILIFCAHSDDGVIGMGGTLIKFVQEGKQVISVIFTYGEKSIPILKEEEVIKSRLEETKKVDKFLGKKSIFLGLKETNLEEQIKKLKIKAKIKALISKYKPSKIFTLSKLDPHKDHRLVNQVVTDVLNKIKYQKDLYSFEVWNVVNEISPKTYIDITPYFKTKTKAMKLFKSQTHFIYPLWLPVYFRARINGFKNNCRYAEMFYKLK